MLALTHSDLAGKYLHRTLAAALAILTVAIVCTALGGCKNTDPAVLVGSELSAMTVAEAAELTYITTDKPDAAIVAKLKIARLDADAILAPVRSKVKTGTALATTDVTTAEQAVTAFQTVLSQNGVNIPTN